MRRFFTIIQKSLLLIAIFASSCPSQVNTYQPKPPKELKKFLK